MKLDLEELPYFVQSVTYWVVLLKQMLKPPSNNQSGKEPVHEKFGV